jgi:putative (di)nucleoside polyphosphate hydrolase
MIDEKGYRSGIGIVIVNPKGQLFWARRIGQSSYQFPQGGVNEGETLEQALYRELYEEVGLRASDVKLIACTRRWLYYDLPEKYIRHHQKPVCIGQKHKWFLLEWTGDESAIDFMISDSPEFDGWKWVSYWHPLSQVIDFKKNVYRAVLREFAPRVLKDYQSRKPSHAFAKIAKKKPY